MLFNASTVYAPGEPHGVEGRSGYQDMSLLGRYHLDKLSPPSVLVGILGLLLVAYLVHRAGRK